MNMEFETNVDDSSVCLGAHSMVSPVSAMPTSQRSLSVLVLEDQDADFDQLQRTLARMEDYTATITRAVSVAQAHALIEERSFDIAFIDYQLPDGFGSEVLPALRKLVPNCRPIMLSGHRMSEVAKFALKFGAVAALSKDDTAPAHLELAIHTAISSVQQANEISMLEKQRAQAEHKTAAIASRVQSFLIDPIASIESNALMIEDQISEVDVSSSFTQCALRIQHAADCATEVLQHVREISEDSSCEKVEFFDFQDPLIEAMELVDHKRQKRQIKLVTSLKTEACHVHGNQLLMRQKLMDLLSRAIEQTEVGGRLKISVRMTVDSVCLTLSPSLDQTAQPAMRTFFKSSQFRNLKPSESASTGTTSLSDVAARNSISYEVQTSVNEADVR